MKQLLFAIVLFFCGVGWVSFAGSVEAATTKPTNISFQCLSTTRMKISWTADSTASGYALRLLDYQTTSTSPVCAGTRGLDCIESWGSTSVEYTVDPTHTYDFWIHSRYSNGGWGDGVRVNGLNCGNIIV